MTEKNRLFILSWDQLGLEACIDATEMEERHISEEKQQVWDILQDKPQNSSSGRDPTLNSIVNMLTLRARVNNHRHYEVYTIRTEYSITEEDMRDMFEEDPQSAADLIRARGHKLYSDRNTGRGVVIK